jgi:hypothetical protein
MTGTDMPRWGWGETDRVAYTSRVETRPMKPFRIDDLPGPPDGLCAAAAAKMSSLIATQAARERDAIDALAAQVLATGDSRGIEVTRTTETTDDGIRYWMHARLSDDVPARTIHWRNEFTTGD